MKTTKPGPKPKLPDPSDFDDVFLTALELGECLGLSRARTYKFLRTNRIPLCKSGRTYLIPTSVAKAIQNGDYFREQLQDIQSVPKAS